MRWCVSWYASGGAVGPVGRSVLDGRVVVQNWSMLTLPLRLLAGAMGVPFTTTRSLLGSSMEEDNARDGDFVATDDPFGGGGRVGLVRAFTPDLALFHAWAADRAGNVIAAAPLNENLDRKSTRLNSSHPSISYAVFC